MNKLIEKLSKLLEELSPSSSLGYIYKSIIDWWNGTPKDDDDDIDVSKFLAQISKNNEEENEKEFKKYIDLVSKKIQKLS